MAGATLMFGDEGGSRAASLKLQCSIFKLFWPLARHCAIRCFIPCDPLLLVLLHTGTTDASVTWPGSDGIEPLKLVMSRTDQQLARPEPFALPHG